jgi:hypothetical protein
MASWSRRAAITESLLIITGSMGAGKRSVLAEASDLLALRHIAHAAIDVDALGLGHLPDAVSSDGVMYRNLESVCRNFASSGVRRFMVARALEKREELDLCRRMVPAANAMVCRITASVATMEDRVKTREQGALQGQYVGRVAELDAILDRARLEDFTISNENRPLDDVAKELLVRAGWLSP